MVKDGIYYGVGFTIAGLLISLVFDLLWAAPLFVLVMVFQRQIVSGLTAGAVKG